MRFGTVMMPDWGCGDVLDAGTAWLVEAVGATLLAVGDADMAVCRVDQDE